LPYFQSSAKDSKHVKLFLAFAWHFAHSVIDQNWPPIFRVCLTVFLSILAVRLMLPLSAMVAHLFSGTLLFVTFVCPGLLIWAQQYKK
jgi:hypothetical protein